jgi:hypothetical protein
MSTVALDPLIAEAKERARRRRLLLLAAGVVVAAAAAIGTTYGLRSSGNTFGICATAPSGFQERTVTDAALGPHTVVLTNFRFGRMDYLYGLSDPHLLFPSGGVLVVVSNIAATKVIPDSGVLRVLRRNFKGIEGATQGPSTQVYVASHGRVLRAEVEVGALTPATVAAANQALAGVRTCSA